MRRIVVIAAGPAGIACATRIKRRLHEHEINIIVPSAIAGQNASEGPAGKRFAAALPNLEALALREVGILETNDIMPDLAARELTAGSSRGSLTIRYSDLVLEVPATVRVPRPLQNAANLFTWPMPGFAADPRPCDAALAAAAASGGIVLVAGSGAAALEAVFLAREAGAAVHWLRTGEKEVPALEDQLLGLVLKELGPGVVCTPLADAIPERLNWSLNDDGSAVIGVTLPDGSSADCACAFVTSPLMARHPVLREDGVVLDDLGRITISERDACPGLRLMGSGSVVPGARLPASGAQLRPGSGGEENAELSAWAALDDVLGKEPGPAAQGALAVRKAQGAGMICYRAGFSSAEAEQRGLDAEYAVLGISPDRISAAQGQDGASKGLPRLILALVCDKASRTLLGVQAFGLHVNTCEADGLFGMALAALADGTSLDVLVRRSQAGTAGRMLSTTAGMLRNKLDMLIKGISPRDFLASRAAGAEFFTLDLRSLPDWRQGHVPDAYNIPLPQLKKRIQDEVPRFTPLVLVSDSGRDAYVAACRLADLGAKDLYVLDGGMQLWPYALEKG